MGVFMITLGVIIYTLIARTFFISPIRRLQSSLASLEIGSTEPPAPHATLDELSMLTRSFNLLSESLNTQENESHVITSRMTDLLAMSDILISTLNLEDLLKEIVSRLGKIMQAKSVSLLLYGREMPTPWAVAHWSDMQQSSGRLPAAGPVIPDTVTVHADPAGDITMTATTKLSAIPISVARAATASNGSGKRRAIRAPKLTPPPESNGLRQPRIPRPALRDLDMLLARMVMQKQKIAYGEDVNAIYRERRETWARLALEAGHQSVVAVPLFLQDRAIGAVMLYGDSPRQVNGPDTFLLSTAAIQAAMAIQNALLFVEVKDKNAALERVNHLKSQFLATVTHELRTPLHSIISYGSLILEGYLDGDLSEEQQEHIQFMVRRAEDLSRLVDDMLDLSKIEADRLEVKVEPLNLEQSLQDVLGELRQIAGNKGLALTLEMEEDLPMALADSHRIRQVLVNLASNALKFTEKGGVTIRCALLERYDMLRISVSDSGIGISPAALDYIFEAFRQADGSTTRRFGGTGLGLTIARKLIELQGGEVTVESIVGQGSTFSFTLPVAAPARVRAS
jgi:signal transduction histidine kinase